MKKRIILIMGICLLMSVSGCSQDAGAAQASGESGSLQDTTVADTAATDTTAADTTLPAAEEPAVPSKEEVLAMRAAVLEGMSEEQIERLTENVKVANLQMERAYLNENLFGKLEDKDSLYWNYFDASGDIQIDWAYYGDYQEMKDIRTNENLTLDEFYKKYGTPVMTYNRFDAENFITLMEEMQDSVQHEGLRADLQSIIDETRLAADTHEMEHANNVYKLLHDMDYFLLRYGPEDVGKYTDDASVVSQYYGTLSVYQ